MDLNKQKRMQELVQKLSEASYAYYQKASEIMSNFEYDALYDELVALEKETGVVLSQSPTQRVGYEVVSALPKVVHPEPMKSLDKTKSAEELADWLGDQEGLLSWKLDGLTVVLTYENGRLKQAATRGNGEVGEDITPNARVFRNVPLTIPAKGKIVVRGEAILSYESFEKTNRLLPAEAQYKNPRNLCSGSVRQLDSSVTASRNVDFLAYFGIFDEETTRAADGFGDSKEKEWQFLKEQGFSLVEFQRVNRENLQDKIREFTQKAALYPYPVDGLVVCYDSLSYAESLGSTAKFPRHSMAFKWQDETAQTIVREIEWSPSRTGTITPVAVFDSVELEGTSVSRASLHNLSVMDELHIHVGDAVTVYKANMIIPQIAENLSPSLFSEEPPAFCPCCGAPTVIKESGESRVLFCENNVCPAKTLKSLEHFASRDAMNMEGLSEATIATLVDADLLKDYAGFYTLENFAPTIAALPGFGEKSCEKLLSAIDSTRKTPLWRFISGLGISGIGSAMAKLLAKTYQGSLEALMKADVENLMAIDTVGEVLAENITHFFANPVTRDLVLRTAVFLTFEDETLQASGDDSLRGLTFVITGSLNHFENRDALKAVIEAKGGKVASSVSKNTKALINNDLTSTSNKNMTARELGIAILSEEDFMNQYLR